MSGLFSARGTRLLALAAPFFLLLLSGCGGNGYSPDLTYPLRTDLIFVDAPIEDPTPFYPTEPGRLDLGLAEINQRKGKVLDPRQVAGADRQKLAGVLRNLFGTPAEPTVGGKEDSDPDVTQAVEALKLQPNVLAEGSRVYRHHCLLCHGVPGDGRGPTGPWVSPHPRDYRQGIFKFISTVSDVTDPSSGERLDRKPRRADLLRTLRRGIDGTTMPSFALLKDEELEDLASYVIHLSLRGQVEYDILRSLLEKTIDSDAIEERANDRFRKFLMSWRYSDKAIEPNPYPYTEAQRLESVRRGYQSFINPEGAASCIKCHEDFGRQVPFRYDTWGTLVRPANLTAGVYRGGRRPIDLYWRIVGGIPPSGMPAATSLKRDQAKKTDEAWDLVNFVQALPYPEMLPEDVRLAIYPALRTKAAE